eukprot:TRINITY_DN8593_c0_g1_i1.p1 TRINITY_DN8593_c0_g1~~TRINITY_DN8593_c0_g1_i1.p1  ORF type:complete len:509 (+),score=84.88 TRINITY_DN8593_c0_g1_i1:94-1620(+)
MALEHDLDFLKRVLTARVYDVCIETPLTYAKLLSHRLNNDIYIKREDLQPVFSFKCRGAYNKLVHLTPEERKQGIVTCSAGNHAQGVALAASKLGVDAKIVMPVVTPSIKVDNVRRLGGNVILFGDDFDAASQECQRISKAEGRIIIHPYDDIHVIAGQGTIGMELLRQISDVKLDYVFCCVGGGGLIAGVSAFIKKINPDIKIIGVEAEGADAMDLSLKQGRRVCLNEVALFADGAAVKLVGEKTFEFCKKYVDGMVIVSNDEICATIKDVFEETRVILEPAGSLGVAGIKKYIQENKITNKTFVGIASGANMDFTRLRFVGERAEIGLQREVLLAVTIPEKPGSFVKLYNTIYPRSVTEFSYRFSDPHKAYIYIAFNVQDKSQVKQIINRLEAQEMSVIDITDNEMAKSHARYLVGGRSPRVTNEKLYRFVFPERPGALKKFLDSLKGYWNVSLFHYRNHGADFGKVLCGIQVPPEDSKEFQTFLDELGYVYIDENNNPVYKSFLL